ncbi:MAG TPA: MmgE/PrpD family protein [Methylomirabilota bacterium]|nr:MmgE/PrpD family protein [Methylomirabilota bacterium]
MTASERLARFVHELDLVAIPAAAREHAKLCVMDTLGIVFAAINEPAAAAAATVARAGGGHPESTLLVHGDRVPAPMAALANGTAAFSHNFTDTTLSCVIHGGPVAVPAALAVGEMAGRSGAEVLTAVVAGYEVMTRVGNAINSGTARMAHHKKGYHPTATCGVFGAAAVAAKLLGLSVDGIVAALGVAGSFAGGLSESLTDGSDVWRAHGGIAAHNGVLAALLAQTGLSGPRAVLDGRKGFCAAFTDGHYDAGALVDGLGERYLVLDAAFKLHNTAHVWALPLDALALLRAKQPFAAADVERMEVTFPQNWTAIMDDPSGATYAPVSYAQATNNLRFCLALGLHAGRVYIDEFDERHLRDAAILDTARRVIPRPDAALGRIFETTDRAPTRLEVVLKSGARHVLDVDYPRGSPNNPATPEELQAKFDALAAAVFPAGRRAAIRTALLDLDRALDIRDLVRLCIRTDRLH